MKIKTSKLSGAALDWAVAKCEGLDIRRLSGGEFLLADGDFWFPSIDWAQGGPIIERERIRLEFDGSAFGINAGKWESSSPECGYVVSGETPLIVAMRCYVASKLGEEVEVPEEVCIV